MILRSNVEYLISPRVSENLRLCCRSGEGTEGCQTFRFKKLVSIQVLIEQV